MTATPGAKMTKAEIRTREMDLHAPIEGATEVGGLIRHALDQKLPVEQLERLFALYERANDRVAAQEFNRAMAAFQAECPPIAKNASGNVATQGGAKFSYKYAQLPMIAQTIAPYLHKHGLSYSWASAQEPGKLTVTCTVRHENGHSHAASCTIPTETKAGMSDQQKVGSALTFGERLSLIQALGITTADPDMDGMEDAADPTTITEDQAVAIEDLIEAVKADKGRFLTFMGVAKVADIRAADYQRAVNALEQKREKK